MRLFDIFDPPAAVIDGFDLVYHHKPGEGGAWRDLHVKGDLLFWARTRTFTRLPFRQNLPTLPRPACNLPAFEQSTDEDCICHVVV